MTKRQHDVMKRAVAEEFGVTHLEDPSELRLFVQSKLSEMNAIERFAFKARVGRILSEAEDGGPPSTRYLLLGFGTVALIAWFIWRPLSAVLAIFACANIRGYAIRRALFWTPMTAIMIGGAYGALLAVLVRIGTSLSAHTTVGGIALGALGFAAAGYIGYRVPTEQYAQTTGDEKRIVAQKAALACYLVVVGTLFFARLLR